MAIAGLLKAANRAPLSALKQYFDVRHNGTGFEMKECELMNLGVAIDCKVFPVKNWEAAERITQGVRGACGDNVRVWNYTMREAYIALYEELLRYDVEKQKEQLKGFFHKSAC